MGRESQHSIEASHAEEYLALGRLADAERCFRELLAQSHHIDYEYDHWLGKLAQIYRDLRRRREAGYISLYAHDFDKARDAFPKDTDPAERARVLEIEKRWQEAAALYEQAGLPVHAAVCHERGHELEAAASLWESLSRHPAMRHCRYEQALVLFNLGMARSRLDPESIPGRHALVESQRKLEQVAEEFEDRGERQRAFDCYQILLKLGKESGQFENLAEGYVNSIRILRDDNLKFYVLQYYEDFVKFALERSELHAAATIFQEAADYATATGLPYAGYYQSQAAETWARCAEKFLTDHEPVELVENAFLAAIGCFSALGNYGEVRRLFMRLSELPLSKKKCERYKKVAQKYQDIDVGPEEFSRFPHYLKQRPVYADIWFADLLEWELGGDPGRVAVSIVGDINYPDSIRRRALVAVLTLADVKHEGGVVGPAELAQVALLLGELQTYPALRPLENLYDHADPQVRQAAIRALRLLFFKRSFGLIRRALKDPEPGVREAALDAIRGLHFPHAFNPLARIYRESDDPQVRSAVVESIGRIQSVEAGEFLLSVMRQEEGVLRKVANQALLGFDNSDVLPIIRQYHQFEGDPELKRLLEELLRSAKVSRFARTSA